MANRHSMTKPIFYIDSGNLNRLMKSGYDSPKEEFDLTVEFTDIPYWAVMHSLKTRTTVTVYRRSEIHSPNEKICTAIGKVTDNRNGKADVSANVEIADNIGPLYWGCLLICDMIRKEHPEVIHADGEDPERDVNSLGDREENYNGFLIRKGKNQWKVVPVRGKERPDLMVSLVFGGEVMARPYMEDIFERDLRESMEWEAGSAGDDS